jgi:hypothetical protein
MEKWAQGKNKYQWHKFVESKFEKIHQQTMNKQE